MAEAPEVVVSEKPEAAPEKAALAPEAGTAPVDGSAPEKATPERTFTQAELDEAIQKRLAKEKRKVEKAVQEAELFKRLALERGEPQASRQPEAKAAQPNERPKLENFKDYDEYIEAVADYKAQQRFSEYESKMRQQAAQERTQREMEQARNSHFEREAKAREKYEDYDEVTRNPSLPISQPMAAAILMADTGPDVYYYLGTHPEEAERISRLTPPLAVMELGKINAKLASTPVAPRPVSRAPAPISPVVANGSPAPTDDPNPNDPIEVWMRKRNMQEAKKKGLRYR